MPIIQSLERKVMEYFRNFWGHRYLLAELVKKGIKLKYRRSYLGIIWSLLEPLLTTIVLTVVFGTLFGVKDQSYPLYVLCGRLLFSLFSSGTTSAMKSIRDNAGMIKKVYVPKYLYPMASILFNFVIFLISLIILIPLSLYCGVYPKASWLLIFVPLILLLMLTFGVGMILATVNVFFRDMEYLWEVFKLLIMYMSAVFYYPEKLLDSPYAFLLKYNPLYCIIEMFRYVLIGGETYSIHHAEYAFGSALILIVIGCIAFYKKQDKFILNI